MFFLRFSYCFSIMLLSSLLLFTKAESKSQDQQEKKYPVSSFKIRYPNKHVDLPEEEELLSLKVKLSKKNHAYAQTEEGLPSEELQLLDISQKTEETWFYESAIVEIAQAIVSRFNQKGFIGIIVTVDPKDIQASGEDIRPKDQKDLSLVVLAYSVKETSSVSLGERFASDHSLNHPAHRHIIRNSPVQEGDLVDRKRLNDYVRRLNRYPNRQVDIQLTGSKEKERLDIDFLINENKAIRAYIGAENTGTKNTSQWLQHIGLAHYHLTGKDDIFSLHYATTGLENLHSIQASYESPFFSYQDLRWNAYISWSSFNSSQLGIFNDEFSGNNEGESLGIKAAVRQKEDFFIDLIASATWRHISVNNRLAKLSGKEDFLIPSLAVQIERKRKTSKIFGSLGIEGNVSRIARTEKDKIELLGRSTKDNSWQIIKASLFASYYLFEEKENRKNKASQHEISLNAGGQYAFSYRLIPQMQKVIGGMRSNRGYPQSLGAGDHAFFIQNEYTYHSFFPQKKYEIAARLFLDVSRSINNKHLSFEPNKTMLGSGIGFDIKAKDYLKISGDWGVALKSLNLDKFSAGHNRAYLSLNILY